MGISNLDRTFCRKDLIYSSSLMQKAYPKAVTSKVFCVNDPIIKVLRRELLCILYSTTREYKLLL